MQFLFYILLLCDASLPATENSRRIVRRELLLYWLRLFRNSLFQGCTGTDKHDPLELTGILSENVPGVQPKPCTIDYQVIQFPVAQLQSGAVQPSEIGALRFHQPDLRDALPEEDPQKIQIAA